MKGNDKAEVLNRFGSEVGVRDTGFEVYEGEIFCLIGLSGGMQQRA